jgi:hypothetical protein
MKGAKKITVPPLYIKLGIMKQFVKALSKVGNCFKELLNTFPHLSDAKIESFLIGPDIRKLMFDEVFLLTMAEAEREA